MAIMLCSYNHNNKHIKLIMAASIQIISGTVDFVDA